MDALYLHSNFKTMMDTLFGGPMKVGEYLGVIGCIAYSIIIVAGILFCMKNYLKSE